MRLSRPRLRYPSMWTPPWLEALRSTERKEAEQRRFEELTWKARAVLVVVPSTGVSLGLYQRRAMNPFDPKASFRAHPRTSPLRYVHVSADGCADLEPSEVVQLAAANAPTLVAAQRLKLVCTLAMTHDGADTSLRALLRSRDSVFWCADYAKWILTRCPPSPIIDTTDDPLGWAPQEVASHVREQMKLAAERRQLLGLAQRMDVLPALAAMETNGVHLAPPASIEHAKLAAEKAAADAVLALNTAYMSEARNASASEWSSPTFLREVLLGGVPLPLTDAEAALQQQCLLHVRLAAVAVLHERSPRVLQRLLRGTNPEVPPSAVGALAAPGWASRVGAALAARKRGGEEERPPPISAEDQAAARALLLSTVADGAPILVVEYDGTRPPTAQRFIGRSMVASTMKEDALRLALQQTDPSPLVLGRFNSAEADFVRSCRFSGVALRLAPVLQVLKAVNGGSSVNRPQSGNVGVALRVAAINAAEALGCAPVTALLVAGASAGLQPTSKAWVEVPPQSPGLLNDGSSECAALRAQLAHGATAKMDLWEGHLPELADKLKRHRSAQRSLRALFDHDQGVFSLAHPDRCLRGELLPTGTATSRLSSRQPNMQNLATDRAIRCLFDSRFGASHGRIVEVDYRQLEVITLALLSGDERMVADLNANIDFHCKRAVVLDPLGRDYDAFFHAAKVEKAPEAVELRRLAKTFSFQRQYGAGVAAISNATGLTADKVRALVEAEEREYPANKAFVDWTIQTLNSGTAGRDDGRVFQLPTGLQLVVPATDSRGGGVLSTAARNFPVQGLAAELTQIMVGQLHRELLRRDDSSCSAQKALLVNTVHDCVWLDTTEGEVTALSRTAAAVLESVSSMVKDTWPGLPCPVEFPVEVHAGASLGALQ